MRQLESEQPLPHDALSHDTLLVVTFKVRGNTCDTTD